MANAVGVPAESAVRYATALAQHGLDHAAESAAAAVRLRVFQPHVHRQLYTSPWLIYIDSGADVELLQKP